VQRGNIGAAPTNGQQALEDSVSIKPTTSRRVSVDPSTGEFVVFDETYPGSGTYHGTCDHGASGRTGSGNAGGAAGKLAWSTARARSSGSETMKYVEPSPASRDALAVALAGGDGRTIAETLVGLTNSDEDWRWVQDTCLELLHPRRIGVRAIAITCLGHLARIHGELDTDKVRPILTELLSDPSWVPC